MFDVAEPEPHVLDVLPGSAPDRAERVAIDGHPEEPPSITGLHVRIVRVEDGNVGRDVLGVGEIDGRLDVVVVGVEDGVPIEILGIGA